MKCQGKTWCLEDGSTFTLFEGLSFRMLTKDIFYMYIEIKTRIDGRYYLWLYPLFIKIIKNK